MPSYRQTAALACCSLDQEAYRHEFVANKPEKWVARGVDHGQRGARRRACRREEPFILRTQPAYYAAMEYTDRQGDCGAFIIYLLERIEEALHELLSNQRPVHSGKERIALFLHEKERSRFSRKDYRRTFPELSTATASRDLAEAVEAAVLEKSGNGRTTWYRAVTEVLKG